LGPASDRERIGAGVALRLADLEARLMLQPNGILLDKILPGA
jgi:hypothetical protein